MKRFLLSTVLFSTVSPFYAQMKPLNATTHPKFQNPVPKLNQIRLSSSRINVLEMGETQQWLGLMDSATQKKLKTTIWGYGLAGSPTYPGPTLLAKSGVPVQVEWRNNLPQNHLLPVDTSYHAAKPAAGVPTVTHLHGGHTESASDGGPEAWYTANYAETGTDFKQKVYNYHNDQEGANLWYHDHTLGLTRLNVYAGLIGFYKLTDANDKALNLPSGNYDRELLFQDKLFYENGEKYYPADAPTGTTANHPSGLPEFFGDFILVNGMIWPYMKVEPRQYRLRLVNASDARVYQFALSNGGSFIQIASDLGKLNKPVEKTQLNLAPGERTEIIIDFAKYAGQKIQFLNNGPDGPYGNPASPKSNPVTTGQIMQFQVTSPFNEDNAFTKVDSKTNLRPLLGDIKPLGAAQVTRKLAVFEGTDEYGRVLPTLGIVDSTNHHDGSVGWTDHITENINLNDTEIWEIYNTTADAHPIHIHLVSFQVLDCQFFTGTTKPKPLTPMHPGHAGGIGATLHDIQFTGNQSLFQPTDNGLKDTYVVQPGERVRLKAKFDKMGSYVWHCHILSHEDHDMMRPIVVTEPCSADVTPPTFTQFPSDTTVTTTRRSAAIQWKTPMATDNCGVPTLSSNYQSGDYFATGMTQVRYQAKDAKGNQKTQRFAVTVKRTCYAKSGDALIEPLLTYPNPAQTVLMVDLKSYEGQSVKAYLYNGVGALEQVREIENVTDAPLILEVAGLVSGQYLLRIEAEGKPTLTQLVQVAH
jgi:spore coat protein A, manganese oxidase